MALIVHRSLKTAFGCLGNCTQGHAVVAALRATVSLALLTPPLLLTGIYLKANLSQRGVAPAVLTGLKACDFDTMVEARDPLLPLMIKRLHRRCAQLSIVPCMPNIQGCWFVEDFSLGQVAWTANEPDCHARSFPSSVACACCVVACSQP